MGMSYGEWGRPLVVLLHALGCHNGWWREVGPALGERYHVIAPNLRGHGTAGPAESYGWADYASDVEALIAQASVASEGQPPPVAIVGHSMGGYVGLSVAARGRVRMGALVILDMKTSASLEELAQMREAAGKPNRPFTSLEDAVARYRLSPAEEIPAATLAQVAADSYGADHARTWISRFDRRALAIEPLDAPALAQDVSCPSLWVRGEHSQVMDRSDAERLARIAGGALHELPGLHHHLPLAAPATVASLIDRFLSSTLAP